jgi:PAS domain S-box-containing protein
MDMPITNTQARNDQPQVEREDSRREFPDAFFKAIVDGSLDPIVIFQGGRILYANEAVSDISGYTIDELMAFTPEDIQNVVHPEDRDQVMRIFGDRISGKDAPRYQEFRFLRKNGDILWVRTSSRFLEIDGNPAIQVSYNDITARKQVEDQLLHSTHEWEETFDASNDAIWLLDSDHRILRCNMRTEQLFHLPRAEVIGKYCWEVVHGTLTPIPDCPMIRMETSLQRETMELQIGDSWFLVTVDPVLDPDGNMTSAVHTIRDITERKLIEESLLTSEANLNEAEHIAHVGNWHVDLRGGKVTWSDELYRIMGVDPEREFLLDEIMEELTHPDDREIGKQAIRDAMATGSFEPFVTRVIRGNGEERTLFTRGRVIRDGNDEPIEFFGIIQDITDRKKHERIIEQSLEEKTILLKEVHHRVKNNFQIISSLLDLQADTLEDERLREHFRASQHRIRSMALIHEKLYQGQDIVRINLHEYLEELIADIRYSYQSDSCDVGTRLETNGILLNLDTAIPVGLLVNELVSNCYKYAFPDPGTDRPDPENSTPPEISITLQKHGDGRFHLEVRDNGVGLPADLDIEDPATLGLQLVGMLTEQLHGSLEIQQSGGTGFVIDFEPRNMPGMGR